MPTGPHADGSSDLTVDATLLADLLRSLAAAMHDRPVQSLVAGRLLLETSLGPGPHDELAERGLAALGAAAEQARDLMWALDGPSLRPDHLTTDIADAVSRVAAPDGEVEVSVTLDEDADDGYVESVTVLAAAVHEVLVDVLLASGHAVRVTVAGDAEGLEAVIESTPAEPGSGEGPWGRLARARLAAHGGSVATRADGAGRMTALVLPLP